MLGLGTSISSFKMSATAIAGLRAFGNTKSLDFDGSNDFVNTNYTANALFRGNFSFSYWVNLDTAVGVSLGLEKGSTSAFYVQHYNGNVNVFHYTNGDVAIQAGGGTPVSNDTWHHVVGTVTKNSGANTSYAVYVDGSAVSISPLGNFTITEANHNAFDSDGTFLAIGASNDDDTPDSFLNGNMDEVAIFNKALSSSEVTAIYNSGAPKNESSHDGLLLYYRFEDDVTDTNGTSNGTNNGATFSSTVPS